MASRRTVMAWFIQIGVLFFSCYLIAQLISAAISTDGGRKDRSRAAYDLKVARNNARCPGCNSNQVGAAPRLTPRHPSAYSSGGVRGEYDRASANAISASPKTVENLRAPISVRDGTSKSNTNTISSSYRRDVVHHQKVPPLSRSVSVLSQPKCSDQLCTEYLTKEDKSRFNSCLEKVSSHNGHVQDGQCHFMPQTHRAPVALASFPGSGNTWLRGLLETATGICTGFEFCDISMRVKGFAGENIVSGAVLVVKTHGFPNWKGKKKHKGGGGGVHFDSAVVLVRNPLDALVAEWNRRVANNFRGSTVSLTSHVKSAGKEMFGTNPKWAEFLREQVPRWESMTKEWITSHGRHAILVVKYEELQKNASHQVKRVLTFLQVPHRGKEVDERLAQGFNSFHRSHKPVDFDHYTPGQRQRILRAINDTIQLLNRSRLSHLLDIHDYLHHQQGT